MPIPHLPNGWTARGDLPDVDARNAAEDQLELLDEDLVQIVDSTGTVTLDVGWYPAGKRDGRYVCRAVYADDWDELLEELETNEIADVSQWIEGWFVEAPQRVGIPDSISDTTVALVMVHFVIKPEELSSSIRVRDGKTEAILMSPASSSLGGQVLALADAA